MLWLELTSSARLFWKSIPVCFGDSLLKMAPVLPLVTSDVALEESCEQALRIRHKEQIRVVRTMLQVCRAKLYRPRN